MISVAAVGTAYWLYVVGYFRPTNIRHTPY